MTAERPGDRKGPLLTGSARGDSRLVKCDGCGKETPANVFADRVVVNDGLHGHRHIAVLTRRQLFKMVDACPVGCMTEMEAHAERDNCPADN